MPQTDNNINFDDLFRYNYRPLCLYALHYLQDADLSEDIVQESYAALWEKLQEGTHVLNRKSYLYMMVRNRCLDHLRKKGIPTESLKPYDTYGIIDDDDAQERAQTELVCGQQSTVFRKNAERSSSSANVTDLNMRRLPRNWDCQSIR